MRRVAAGMPFSLCITFHITLHRSTGRTVPTVNLSRIQALRHLSNFNVLPNFHPNKEESLEPSAQICIKISSIHVCVVLWTSGPSQVVLKGALPLEYTLSMLQFVIFTSTTLSDEGLCAWSNVDGRGKAGTNYQGRVPNMYICTRPRALIFPLLCLRTKNTTRSNKQFHL